jgi:hypothetical protein
MLEILHTHGGKVRAFPKLMKQFALEAARQKFDHGEISSMFAEPKKDMGQVLKEVFGGDEDAAADEKVASFREASDLVKGGPDAASAYVSRAVTWELNNLMRQEVVQAGGSGKARGGRIVRLLRAFITEQVKADPKFARAYGSNPLSDAVLMHLVRLKAKASVIDLAKSIAAHSLWHNAFEARASACSAT